MDILAELHPAALAAAVFVLGLCVGSFLNVVILRLPARMFHDWRSQCRELLSGRDAGNGNDPAPPGIVVRRSYCPACKADIRWFDNIPVLSWLLLRGRCRDCKAPISPRYLVVELATAILSVIVIWHFGPTETGLAALVFTWVLIAASGIDIDHQLLPDQMILPLLWLGLALNLFGMFTDLESAVIGAIAGYLVLWAIFHLFRLLTGKEGMGYGDFKLLAAAGAWFGWQVLPVVILLASLVGAVFGIAFMLIRGQGRNVPIAFGPYLAGAAWIAMIWGETLLEIYLR